MVFVVANALFAVVYMLDKGIENARPGSFADAFFFSVQTMATIGYGKMDPDTFLAEVMVSIEALIGLVGLAMTTGLVFAKFSRPTARVRFSRVALVSNRDGVPSLQFRMANLRANRIVDVSARVVFARQERTLEGEEMRRFYDLKLQRDRNAIFIYLPDRHSSDYRGFADQRGQQGSDGDDRRREIIVSVIGLDEILRADRPCPLQLPGPRHFMGPAFRRHPRAPTRRHAVHRLYPFRRCDPGYRREDLERAHYRRCPARMTGFSA